MADPLKKNRSVTLEITGITHQGSGVGRWEGMAVFVPGTAPGDVITAKIVKVLSRHAFGIVEELHTPSPHRVEPGCPAFSRCGGCSLRHLSYEEELAVKNGWVRENLRRVGGVDLALDAPLPSPAADRYRNKAQYPVARVDGRITAGFYAGRSHRLIAVKDCSLQPRFFAEITGTICRFMETEGIEPYDEESHTGLVRHIYIRHGEVTGQVMVCLVLNGNRLPGWEKLLAKLRETCPALTTLVLNRNTARSNVILGAEKPDRALLGDGFILDEICGLRIKISPRSFYQVNRAAAELLYRQAADYAGIEERHRLLDLYCGAGAIGLSMASRAAAVTGIEIIPEAVRDAEYNAIQNGIGNARFLCLDAAEGAARLREEGRLPHIVLLDPPRKGLSEQGIGVVASMRPEKIVYISCNSATLARDLAAFSGLGYRATRGRAVDLFPRTAHVETVILLSKI